MNHGPVVLSETGSKLFWAHEAWHDHCLKNNIANPWKLMRECEDKVNKHWKEVNEKGHTIWYAEIRSKDEWPEEILNEYKKLEAYRDQYMCDREIWEGQYILENYGYDTLITFAQTHRQDETAPPYDRAFHEWFKHVKPCEGADGQCHIACELFTKPCGKYDDLYELFW